jgi:hypothetical protein
MSGTQLIDGKRASYFIVPVEQLKVWPKGHPNFDERSLYTSDKDGPYNAEHPMVRNVIAIGVHDPLTVRALKVSEDYTDTGDGKTKRLEPGEYVVNGHQRRLWALAAKKELHRRGEPDDVLVPVMGEKTTDLDYLATLSLALNRTVADDPMVTARKLAAYLARCGGDHAKAAAGAGVTVTFLKQHVALLGASAPLQAAVTAGEVKPSAAAKVADLPKNVQTEVLDAAKKATAKKTAEKGEDGRTRTKATTKAVATAAKAAKAAIKTGGDTKKAAEEATEKEATRPTDAQIRKAYKKALDSGANGIARALNWVLTGDGEPV